MPRMPNVFTIPAGESFADNLVRGLLARHGQTPLELAQVTLLLPSRRGARAVREAFLRQADGRPMLLPMMRAVGDVDEEELAFDGLHGGDMLDLPPAIPALRRQLLLAQLIGRQRGIDVVQAAPLARELAALLDRLQTEEVPFSALADLVPADFAAHWRITLDFLRLLEEPWQQLLAAEGGLDPAERRNRLLRAQSRRWRQRPPAGPVVVAGSTGSIPATAELIAVVAGLPGGAVVLPGLDRLADAETWAAVDPCHPQHGMKQLLETIGVDREQVAPWHGSGTAGRRDALLAEALRPTETTERWRHLPALGRDAVAGLARVDCASPQEEAGVIALALRQALETPGRTAALVTPDRGLARRVVAEMLRWGIAIDDSAGLPLAATPPGTLLRLTAVMLVEGLAPIALLAALKHPLARAGGEAGRTRRLVRELDRKALRGPRPAVGFAGLEGAVAAADGVSPAAVELVAELHRRGARVLELVTRPAAALADIVAGHVTFAEWLATDRDGECHLWRGEAGEAAMGFIAELLAAAEGLPPLAGAGYAALLAGLMEGLAVRPAFGLHPRLHIWGPLEARLQSADLLVLG
ncbi:MAG: double-strand break repair protein AddB, partial [Alphaproteobacteria bacterium]|nr:double-strand break repair protein AddB [Alphaproteobacteria bacterium]